MNTSKVIIVTGGASGIGYTFARHLMQNGHRLVVADLKGAEEAAERLVSEEGGGGDWCPGRCCECSRGSRHG